MVLNTAETVMSQLSPS